MKLLIISLFIVFFSVLTIMWTTQPTEYYFVNGTFDGLGGSCTYGEYPKWFGDTFLNEDKEWHMCSVEREYFHETHEVINGEWKCVRNCDKL